MRFSPLFLALALAGCPSTPNTPDAPPGADAPPVLDAPMVVDAPLGDDAPVALDAASDATTVDDAGCSVDLAAVEAGLEGLLFTSESDYPLVLETFAGEGDAAPTPEDVVRLSGAVTGASTGTGTIENYWLHIVVDPTITPPIPDTRPAELRAAIENALTDLVYVRIIDPANPAQVRVYLVGRACGDLVWLSSTSIET